MKNKMKLVFPAALAVSLCALPMAQAAAPATEIVTNKAPDPVTQLFGDPTIAKGKGFEVKQSELDKIMSNLKASAAAQGQSISPAQEKLIEGRALYQLISVRLLLLKATDADRAEGAKKADANIAQIIKRAGSQELVERSLKVAGVTMDELRAKATDDATAGAVLTRELKIDVSDADVKKFYDDHPSDFEQPETVEVQHILFMTMDPSTRQPLPTDQQQAKRKQIDDLLKRIKAGEDFSKLAAQYSEDPGSKDNGGKLPAFPRGQMVPEFEAAAFSMTTNQVSDVVTSPYGYHIIKLLAKTPAKKVDFATVSDDIKSFLTRKAVSEKEPAYIKTVIAVSDVQVLDPSIKLPDPSADANN